MIDTKQIALNGLYPGWSTYTLATVGHLFKLAIIVETPSLSDDVITRDYERKVTVMIVFNRKIFFKNAYHKI